MVLDRVRTVASLGARATRAVRDVGVLHPVRPDRAVRLVFAGARFGPTPATLGAMAALRFPTRTALHDERGALTYAELEQQAAAVATALHQRLTNATPSRNKKSAATPTTTEEPTATTRTPTRPGEATPNQQDAGKPEARIGVLCRNHRGFVISLLAASRLGNDVVLLNTDFSATQLGDVTEREGVRLLLHDQEFDEVVEQSSFDGQRVHAWTDHPSDSRLPTIEELADTEPVAYKPPRPSRVVILTSGTTGTPKGARHDVSLAAVVPAALSHLMRVPVRSGTPILVAPPLFHVLGMAYMLVALGMGMPLVLLRRFDPGKVLDAVDAYRVEALVAVPVMLQRILDASRGRPLPDSLRVVVSGGSALHPHLSEAFMDVFGDVLHNVYGATETGWATIATPRDLREAPGTVGRPTFRLTIKILDEDGRELPSGEIGEIYTGGGLRFAGYTGGGGKRVHEGLASSGDLGHFDSAGRLFVDGRADDMIVSGGENVFPGEVEDLLGRHPDVAEVAVVGVEDADFGQRLAAYVVRERGASIDEEDVKRYVKENLARYKVPRDVYFVDELPRTSSGKVRPHALPN
ncbi:AMP-binding protein [Actinomadura sp. NPDC047616]|uniref:AMP-binding protein n=1 Tax=Actinomadura sp. NPDC047616 TaxID=3155914 RepID=UPI00340A431A